MKITKDAAVAIEYTLKNSAGELIDESDGTPLHYLHGHGQIVPGLEAALEGQTAGAQLSVVVAAKDGYGEKRSKDTIRVPLEQFDEVGDIETGMPIEAVGDDGQHATLWVVGKDQENVELSIDHPLAGVALHFDVHVTHVRAATREELSHGHIHGPGGHHHH